MATSATQRPTEGFEFLREKYRIEREKRLRRDGAGQYLSSDDPDLQEIAQDFYTTKYGHSRPSPQTFETDVLIIGAGFAGINAGVQLLKTNVTNFCIVDKAAGFGGNWYWNRYPGLRCDIEAYCYMPMLEEMNYMPTERYASQPEILDYSQKIAKKFGLYEKALFQADVIKNIWDDAQNRWLVSTRQGDIITTKFVIIPGGLLHKPKLPGLPGIKSFKGHSFHSARWDYEYTGGDYYGGLTKLADKTVGIIGTGATAIQVIPHLANHAKHLYVFQRTPSSVDVRDNPRTDPEWARKLEPGWQQERMENFNLVIGGVKQDKCLVEDGWTDIIRKFNNMEANTDEEKFVNLLIADDEKMNQLRKRVDDIVKDSETAEKLKPWYKHMCKRPCFHEEYLSSFNKPNVTLVDTSGKGVESITTDGVVANGKEYPLDCIIYSTGFYLGTNWRDQANMQIVGRNGLTIGEKWADGPSTFHSMMTRNFPNCFFLQVAQAGVSPNFTHLLCEEGKHMAYIVSECVNQKRGEVVEPTLEKEQEWTNICEERGKQRNFLMNDCVPGYYTNEGMITPAVIKGSCYSVGGQEFFEVLKKWRDDGKMEGMEMS